MQQVALIEERLAEARTEIRRNGKVYSPVGERMVPVDARAHAELLAVSGIVTTPWADLAPVTTGTTLPTASGAPITARKPRRDAAAEGGNAA